MVSTHTQPHGASEHSLSSLLPCVFPLFWLYSLLSSLLYSLLSSRHILLISNLSFMPFAFLVSLILPTFCARSSSHLYACLFDLLFVFSRLVRLFSLCYSPHPCLDFLPALCFSFVSVRLHPFSPSSLHFHTCLSTLRSALLAFIVVARSGLFAVSSLLFPIFTPLSCLLPSLLALLCFALLCFALPRFCFCLWFCFLCVLCFACLLA